MQACGYCHRADISGSEVKGELAPELVGAYFFFDGMAVSLLQLLIKIDDEMPKDAPGTVTSEAAADIVSYLLEANDARPGAVELPRDREKVKQFLVHEEAVEACGSRIANSRADSRIGQRCVAPGV